MYRVNWLGELCVLVASAVLSGCAAYGPHWSPETTPILTQCKYIKGNANDLAADRLACEEGRAASTMDEPLGSYRLAILEFDEYGNLFDPDRGRALIEQIEEVTHGKTPFIALTYVHGWKHSARDKVGGDLREFRGMLQNVVSMENNLSRLTGQPPREVIGVYLGWRGGSLEIPFLENITFWDRKNTAQAVGDGAVAEVLTRLNDLRERRNLRLSGPQSIESVGQTYSRLITVGHSFGGAVVHTAVSQMLVERLVRSESSQAGFSGIGDLVVLVNPAFEAMRLSTLHKLANRPGEFPSNQFPSLVVLTTESDGATKTAFPFGRFFSTFFDSYSDGSALKDEGRRANLTAVGHYEPYQSHFLSITAEGRADPNALCSDYVYPKEAKSIALRAFAAEEDREPESPRLRWIRGDKEIDIWKKREDGTHTPPLMRLTRIRGNSHSPVLNIKTDAEFIKGHNEIYSCYVPGFIKELVAMTILVPDTAGDKALSVMGLR